MEIQIHSAVDEQASYFKKFVQLLVKKFQPLQLFCFAKTNLVAETAGCFKDHDTSYHGNYCLLMITAAHTRIDHEVQEFANFHYKKGKISIICHSQDAVSTAVREDNRFFSTIYHSGQLLYSQDGMTHFDFTRKIIPVMSSKKAQEHFDNRMPLAEGFLRGAAECLAKQDFKVSTFMLHQVVEQCCILLISVYLDYRSEVHNLERMLRLCSSFSDKPLKMFLSRSTEDQRLFDLLVKSYSGARYGAGFSVAENDVKYLYDRTVSFVNLVKGMCTSKIEEMAHECLLYQELQEEGKVVS